MEPEDAIFEAAESPTLARVPKWPALKVFLRKRGITASVLDSKGPQEWLKELADARETLKDIDIDVAAAENKEELRKSNNGIQSGSNQAEDRGSSIESRRESDGDSGFHSEASIIDRPEAVIFLVPGHKTYDEGKAVLYCSYSATDDQSYIAQIALEKLNISKSEDGSVTLTFLDGDHASTRKFLAQDCTSNGEKFKSDIRFGLKTPAETEGDESPLEEVSHMADGGDDRHGSESVFQTHNALMTPRRMLRQLQDDEAKMLGYAIGVSSKDTDDPLSEEDQGHRIGILARAAIDSFRR